VEGRGRREELSPSIIYERKRDENLRRKMSRRKKSTVCGSAFTGVLNYLFYESTEGGEKK